MMLPRDHRQSPTPRPIRRPRRTLAALALALVLMWAGPVAAQSLQTRVNRIINSRQLARATCAVYVMDLADGSLWVEHNGDLPVIPASNHKLLTTAAALETLGPDFVFETRLVRLDDHLIVVGSGDPSFGDSELLGQVNPPLTVEDLLARWVRAVKNAGIQHVDQLILDDRVFDRQFIHPHWPTDQLINWYCAEVGGINFNDNCLDVYTSPSHPGQAPFVHTIPMDPPITLHNVARTDLHIRNDAPWFSREPQTNNITVHGRVKLRKTAPLYVTIHNPPLFFGKLLARRLRAAGIEVGTVRLADDNDTFASARLVASVRMPLQKILQRCNADSQNLFAEALLKRVGKQVTGESGSWDNGTAALRQYYARLLGPDAARMVIDDGSGMSRENRLTARLLVRLLQHMRNQPDLWPTFADSLSLGGVNGTLQRRFTNNVTGTVRGKSGYLRGVIALSGYIEHDQHDVAFSIILNNFTGSVFTGKALIDSIVVEIDREMTRPVAPPIPSP